MKSILFAVVLALTSAQAVAKSNWELMRIDDRLGGLAGYVYYNDAVGSSISKSQTKKVVSSLRLVCSSIGGDPLLIINWEDEFLTLGDLVVTTYYNNTMTEKRAWQVDKNVMYTSLATFPLPGKSVRFIKLTWTIGSTEFMAGYNAAGFDIEKFTTACADR